MKNYDVTTLPEDYDPVEPTHTGGFRIFIVACCLLVLTLGGVGFYNWLSTGDLFHGVSKSTKEAAVEKYMESEVKQQVIKTIELRTADGVTVLAKVTSLGELSAEAIEGLRNIMAATMYSDIPQNKQLLLDWTTYYGVVEMHLKSNRPIPTQ
jgi:hypothetical protein